MESIELTRWPEFLIDWATLERAALAGSPTRNEIRIDGEVPNVGGKARHLFRVGTARDAYGTLLHLSPAQDVPIVVTSDKNIRTWNRLWAKIAVRAGYMQPAVDPVAFARLSVLRQNAARVEFIVDTNVLISGVGHWLVRWFGDTADLVRTVVTDLELQRFVDQGIWNPKDFNNLDKRACYLGASRFLEFLSDKHPIWRRLDTAEETALFTAKASDGKKESGTDTLLLRAARRSIQDQVPGLERFFVTTDQALARAAAHDLPTAATIAAYINPLPTEGVYLSSLHWWPAGIERQGQGYLSMLADFVYEATCLCDHLTLTRGDGATLRVSGYLPGANQFPSDWRRPLVWYETSTPPGRPVTVRDVTEPGTKETQVAETSSFDAGLESNAVNSHGPSSSKSAGGHEEVAAEPKVPTIGINIRGSAGSEAKSNAWPAASIQLLPPQPCAARVAPHLLLDAIAAVMAAAKEGRKLPKRLFEGAVGTIREMKTFLKTLGLLTADDRVGPDAGLLVSIFAQNDLDNLSALLTRASNYHNVIAHLREKRVLRGQSKIESERSFGSVLGAARLLGQAVQLGREVAYGGEYISRQEFVSWLQDGIAKRADSSPLHEVAISDLAASAIEELGVSPARFERMLDLALRLPAFSNVEPAAGGTPEAILVETIADLSAEGWRPRRVSADGLLGYRTLRRNPR